MTLKFLVSAMLLSITVAGFSQSTIPSPTHYITQQSYGSNVPLTNSEQWYLYYDANNKQIGSLSESWNGSAWNLWTRSEFTNNADGKLLNRLTFNWDAALSDWKVYSQSQRTYDAAGLELTSTEESIDPNTNMLAPTQQFENTYTATQKLSSETRLFLNASSTFGSRTLYTYNVQDRVSETIAQALQTDGSWKNQNKRTFFYTNADDKEDLVDVQNWDDLTNNWATVSEHITYTYLPFLTTVETETIVNGVFTVTARTNSIYNSNLQLTTNNYESWNPTTQSLEINSGFDLFYNADKSINRFAYYYRDFQTKVVFQSLEILYDYGVYTGTQNIAALPDLQVFPNPTNGPLQVQLSTADAAAQPHITVVDAAGALVADLNDVQNGKAFSLENQPKGVYFIRVEAAGGVRVVPVVKN
jgi:Secretion system C-terminal sorting domain